MKKYILSIIFALFASTNMINGQVTPNPLVDNQNSNIYIEAVFVYHDQTTIVINMGAMWAFNWVSVDPETYIEYSDPQSGKMEQLKIVGIKGFRNKSEVQTGGVNLALGKKHESLLGIRLDFPAIPRGVTKINLVERVRKGFYYYGIHIKGREDMDLPRIATTEQEIDSLIKASNSKFAGIYMNMSTFERLALIRDRDIKGELGFLLINMLDNGDFKLGDIKAFLEQTATNNIFTAIWINKIHLAEPAVVEILPNGIRLNYTKRDTTFFYIRMGENNNETSSNEQKWSGTGFAYGNGYIVTNHHVVDEAKSIKVKGIAGTFTTEYSAEVVASDKVNDIAILKINDSKFSSMGTIPYNVSTRMAEVGEDIFVLGYPLTQTMGDEIKLTNGIVSSRTGFQGDVSNYQITAPIQPGNSGGPMFDSKGNVIGIVVAHHAGAENAGYAIKTSYLKNLIESAGLNIVLPSGKNLSNLSLSEKVKRIKPFVYLIECSK
jgi:S1-C subfamily serine protease